MIILCISSSFVIEEQLADWNIWLIIATRSDKQADNGLSVHQLLSSTCQNELGCQ